MLKLFLVGVCGASYQPSPIHSLRIFGSGKGEIHPLNKKSLWGQLSLAIISLKKTWEYLFYLFKEVFLKYIMLYIMLAIGLSNRSNVVQLWCYWHWAKFAMSWYGRVLRTVDIWEYFLLTLLGKQHSPKRICFWQVNHSSSDVPPANAHVITKNYCFSINSMCYLRSCFFRDDNSEH